MPFVQGKCENCGGILTVDPSLKAANCPFCGIAYVVQDSINYYNTTIKVESLHADVVNISDESSSEGRIKAADAYMKLGKYDLAYSEYLKVSKLTPQNHLGWLGMIASYTNNYTKRIISASELQKIKDYSKSVMLFAPNDTGKDLLKNFDEYIKVEEDKNNSEIDNINQTIAKQEGILRQLNQQTTEIKGLIALNGNERVTLSSLIDSVSDRRLRGFIIIGSVPTLIGVMICFVDVYGAKMGFSFSLASFIVGLFFILVGGIPYSKAFRDKALVKRMNNKLIIIQAKQSEYEHQLDDIQRHKISIKSVINSKQNELERYK